MAATHQVILDTDIGSDVDDALALAMIFGAPEIELLGVTTVYGDVRLRALVTRRLARLAGHDGLAVVAGAERPLTGADAWWAGFEGRLYDDLGAEAYLEDLSAVEFLTRTVAERPGEIDVVAIGPLTNIAEAIRADESFARNVRRLHLMGGRFDRPEPEHNFRSDAVAAAEVFASGIPVTVVGLEITTQARIGPDHLGEIAAAGALGRQLEAEVRQWWNFTGEESNVPHDPLAVLAMLRTDLLGSRPVTISVEPEGERAGASTATDDPQSRTRVVTSVVLPDAVDHLVKLIATAGHCGPS